MFFGAKIKVHSWLSIGKYGILLVCLAKMAHLFLSELA